MRQASDKDPHLTRNKGTQHCELRESVNQWKVERTFSFSHAPSVSTLRQTIIQRAQKSVEILQCSSLMKLCTPVLSLQTKSTISRLPCPSRHLDATRASQRICTFWQCVGFRGVSRTHQKSEGTGHLGVHAGLKKEPSMVNTGSILAKVRSSASSQAHLDEVTRQAEEQESLSRNAPRRGRSTGAPGRQGEALVYDVHRLSVLGSSPKEARSRIPAALEPGFYICRSDKKKVRTLHQLGRCYLLPGVDYIDHTSAGLVVPKK